MVCYIVPAAAGIIHYGLRKKISRRMDAKYCQWLSFLFLGGAIFGIIDHWWNGELFLLGKSPLSDLMLGVTITLAILLAWAAIAALDKSMEKDKCKTID